MTSETRQVSWYFGLVILLTTPIWILGASNDFQLLPGLPIAALAVVCPALAAATLCYWRGGWPEVLNLVVQGLNVRKAGWPVLVVMLVNPVLFGLAFMAARALGAPVPDPTIGIPEAVILFALFLPAALLEEIGWTGFALSRLQASLSPWACGLALGLFWAGWHIPALLQVGRSVDWIAWWCLWTVSARVIMVWVYFRTGGSVFAVVIYHAMSNLCWQLYPVAGSYFDPKISGLVTLALAMALTFWSAARLTARHAP